MDTQQEDQLLTVTRLEELEAALACIEVCLRGNESDTAQCAQAIRSVRRGLVDLVVSIGATH